MRSRSRESGGLPDADVLGGNAVLTVTAHFLDGARIDGELDAPELPSDDFSIVINQTNIQSVRVAVGALKCVVVREEHPKISKRDPRERSKAQKVVLGLVDGSFMHTYRDDFFADVGQMLHVRLWNPELS